MDATPAHVLARFRTERARQALTQLVKLGCVPHELARCMKVFTNEGERNAVAGSRREMQLYLPRLRQLARSFERLAEACDQYKQLPKRYGNTTFRLDRHVAAFLRDEAAMMRDFIRDADPRRPHVFTKANHHLMDMMRDIKTITGAFQDPLVAALLEGIGIRMNAERLKKMRLRFRTRSDAWVPPRYFTRPVSRISMDATTAAQSVKR